MGYPTSDQRWRGYDGLKTGGYRADGRGVDASKAFKRQKKGGACLATKALARDLRDKPRHG